MIKVTKTITVVILLVIGLITPAISSQSVYIQEESFLIPWGEGLGEISSRWYGRVPFEMGEGLTYPGPSSVNRTGGYVIYYGKIVKYSPSGNYIAEMNSETLKSLGRGRIENICIANCGDVLLVRVFWNQDFSTESILYFLNPSLELIDVISLEGRVSAIYPSANGGYWVRYIAGIRDHIDDYYVEFNADGSMSTPVQLFSGWSSDPSRPKFRYITPDGQLFPKIIDKYGYYYHLNRYGSHFYLRDVLLEPAAPLKRYSPSDELVYEHSDVTFENWNSVNRFFPTWDGDFYHQYGAPEGLVITRFELNLPPDCFLFLPMPIPPGPMPPPFAVTFDGTRTRDPNNDTLTFEWDFDGDGVFSEPVDDAYTGPPNNPTHLYYTDFDGDVTMRVRDPYDGECTSFVHIHVDIV